MEEPRFAKWMFEEGIRHKSIFEPLHFQRMRGGQADNYEQLYDYTRSRDYMKHLADEGYTQVWFNWWKGYGLNFEKRCQDQAAELFGYVKELGMHPACYCTFGSLTLDTLLLEEPDSANWISRGQDGQPTTCQVTNQTFRYRPCYNSQGWLAYMERVVGRALDCGADGIHFDNIGPQFEPETCKCPECTRLFREYLQERFGGELGERVFGMSDFRHASVPWFNRWNTPTGMRRAHGPHHLAWIDFKCRSLSQAGRRMAEFIHGKNPDAFIEMNCLEAHGQAAAYWRGEDYDELLSVLDLAYDEKTSKPGINQRGAMVSPERSLKWASRFGTAVLGIGGPVGSAVNLACNLAGNSSPLGFFRKWKDFQLKARPISQVAVLRERNSLAYNRWEPWEQTLAAEQYLIERRIPFDLVVNKELDDLGQYRLLIVAGAEVISDAVRDRIASYVSGGGSVLLSGAAGQYNEYYQHRGNRLEKVQTWEQYLEAGKPKNAFWELIGADPDGDGQKEVRKSFGQGRVAWVCGFEIDPLPRTPENYAIFDSSWQMPANAEQIDELIGWLVPDGFDLTIETADRIAVYLNRRVDTKQIVLHLVNFAWPDYQASAVIQLRMSDRPGEVFSISHDDEATDFASRRENFDFENQTLLVRLMGIDTHRVVVISP